MLRKVTKEMERYLEWRGGLNAEWGCSEWLLSKSSKAGEKKKRETQGFPDINLTMQNVYQLCGFILWGVSLAVCTLSLTLRTTGWTAEQFGFPLISLWCEQTQ